jgi:broad specificity phosphatase PhoE
VQLICVRHGRTAWNAGRRFQGHTDVPLDEEGRAQAVALGSLLRRERIDAAVSSDLARAVETARIVIAPRALELRLDPDWREMRFGAWEGLTWEEICASDPHVDRAGGTLVRAYAPPGGETFDELCARVRRAVDRAVDGVADDGTVLVATHAGPLHALLAVLLDDTDVSALKVRFMTASLTRFRRERGRWRLARLNQTAQGAAS